MIAKDVKAYEAIEGSKGTTRNIFQRRYELWTPTNLRKSIGCNKCGANLALERHHQQLCKEHIAYALLNDEEGLIPKLVTKCGADAPQLVREIDRILSQMPSVTGSGASEVYLSQDCSLMLSQAEKTQRNRATIL